MKIIADENITYAKEAFSAFGNVILQPGRNIVKTDLMDTDILIIRSVTKINEKLLKDTKIKFVATATIGTDHIDLNYLNNNNIHFTSAKGCNSHAVAEYVLNGILTFASKKNINLENKTIGIIGAGNIGSIVSEYSKILGLKVFLNDPPLAEKKLDHNFVDLNDALTCDIVTFHVPLTKSGKYPTFHLLNESNISIIKKNALLINASRGEVIDNKILLKYLRKKQNIFTILDVWENEPAINLELLKLVDIATPHIAGYSVEGKLNGTRIIFDKLNSFFDSKHKFNAPILKLNKQIKFSPESNFITLLTKVITEIGQISDESFRMKNLLLKKQTNAIENFDLLRKTYSLRHEFDNYILKNINRNLIDKFKKLRFQV